MIYPKDEIQKESSYSLSLHQKQQERLQSAIKVAEDELNVEHKIFTTMVDCFDILEDGSLIGFATSDDGALRTAAASFVCGNKEILGKHIEKATGLVGKLFSTGTEAEDSMPGLTSIESASTVYRLACAPQSNICGNGLPSDSEQNESAVEAPISQAILEKLLRRHNVAIERDLLSAS